MARSAIGITFNLVLPRLFTGRSSRTVLVIAKRVVSNPTSPGLTVAVNTTRPVPPGGNVSVIQAGTLRFTRVIGGHIAPKPHVEVTHRDGEVRVKGQPAFTTPPKRISGGSKAIRVTSFAEADPEFV
jgi:hypothetical protein